MSEDKVIQVPTQAAPNPMIVAIKNLTQGTQNLLKHHLELARHEITSDLQELSKDTIGLIAALGMALLGYLLLNMTGILLAAWFAGIKGMALTSGVLALLHLGGGALAARAILTGIKERRYGMTYTGNEIERSKEWVKETTTGQSGPAAL